MTTWTKETINLAIAGDSLTIDDIVINGENIGHTDDTDLLYLQNGLLYINGSIACTGGVQLSGDLTIQGGNITNAITCDSTLTVTGTLTASGNAIVGGDLTISGGNITNAITCDSTVTTTGLLTANANIVVGANDGTDKSVLFGHDSMQTIIGIDHSQVSFAINTDNAFESVNDFEIKSDGTTVIGNGDLVIGVEAKLRLDGNTAGNTYIYQPTDGKVQLVANGQAINMSTNISEGSNTVYGKNCGTNLVSGQVNNTFIGDDAAGTGTMTDTADSNTGIGFKALEDLTSGNSNVAVGVNALGNCTEGYKNIAIGRLSLNDLTTGYENTSVGFNSGPAITDASLNALFGTASGYYITEGSYNTGIGWHSLYGTTTDNHNTAVGYNSLKQTQSSGGDVDGHNVGIGTSCGFSHTTGTKNVLIGSNAGTSRPTTGSENVLIGWHTEASADAGENQIAIGNNADGQGDNIASIGNADCEHLYAGNDKGAKVWCTNIDSSSDSRIKKNINACTLGLDFIKSLNPVTFNMRKVDEWDDDLKALQSWTIRADEWVERGKTPRDIDDTELKIGFIAQEVKTALGSVDCDIYEECESDGIKSLDYSRFVAPIVKAIQELSARIDSL